MRIVPVKDSVVCERVEERSPESSGGILFEEKTLPLYRVLSFSEGDGFEFEVGDVVAVLGKGDEVEISPGRSVFRFNVGNVMCRVLDN